MFLYVFDLLHLAGHDTTALPLRARKGLLRRALSFDGPVRLTPHRNRDGEELFREACRKGWEGLIAKRADSPYTYRPVARLAQVQVLEHEQELVIGGYTAPQGLAGPSSARCCSATTTDGGCATRARSAPASRRRR